MTDKSHTNPHLEKQLLELRGYVLRCSAPEPEDLYQEVCLEALRLNLDWSCSQSPLLKRITRFRAALQWRHAYQRRRRETYIAGEPEARASTTAEVEIDRESEAATLNSAMERLSDADRAIIRHIDLDGQSLQELANETGCPYRTIQSRLKRARARLGRLCHLKSET